MVQQSQDQSDWAVASFDPADQTQGGLFGEANGLISDAEFVFWDYQGKAPPTIALKLKIVDDEGAENEQVWSVGHPTRVALKHGRKAVGIELSKEYTVISTERLKREERKSMKK